MRTTSVMLPEKTIERLKKEADRYGISMAEMMRRIFDTYFELENNKEELVTFTKKILSHYNALPDEWDELNSILGKD